MSRAPRGTAVATLALLLVAGPALAQQAEPPAGGDGSSESRAQGATTPVDPEREARARFLFEEGRTAFYEGRFEEALALFRRAHELSGRDELLYNIGQSLDRLRRDEEAIEVFEQYLQRVPEAPNRGEVEARLRVLREAVARDRAAPPPTPPERRPGEEAPRQRASVEASRAEPGSRGAERGAPAGDAMGQGGPSPRRAEASRAEPLAPQPQRPDASEADGGWPWWAWTLVGVGLTVGALAGLALWADAADTPPEVPGTDWQVRY